MLVKTACIGVITPSPRTLRIVRQKKLVSSYLCEITRGEVAYSDQMHLRWAAVSAHVLYRKQTKGTEGNVIVLRNAAKHGRILLILGLLAGATLPQLAQVLRPWLPELVAVLLFLTAMRVGHRMVLGSLTDLRRVVGFVLMLQLAAPLLAATVLSMVGGLSHPFALAVVLMLAAPSVTGAPNFLIMMGKEPAHALRILVLGTALFPVTVLPVLWMLPALDSAEAIVAAFRLIVVILAATAAGFIVRAIAFPKMSGNAQVNLDGLSAVTLAIIVIGLMSEIGPLSQSDPRRLLGWAIAVLCLNFGLQIMTHLGTRHQDIPESAAVSIISGNRNIALFLIALPSDVTGPLLVFIGCYQIPMYLTPIVMQRVYRDSL